MSSKQINSLAVLVAEVLSDGRIDLSDVVALIRYVSGENWIFPVCAQTLQSMVEEISGKAHPSQDGYNLNRE